MKKIVDKKKLKDLVDKFDIIRIIAMILFIVVSAIGVILNNINTDPVFLKLELVIESVIFVIYLICSIITIILFNIL